MLPHRARPQLSGTPFNNNVGDLLSVGSFIDATSSLATERYYADKRDALADKRDVVEAVFPPELYLRRGKQHLETPLPAKHVGYCVVQPSAEEIAVYEPKEHALEKTLKQLVKWKAKRARTPRDAWSSSESNG